MFDKKILLPELLPPPPPEALMVTAPVPPAGEMVTPVPATIWVTAYSEGKVQNTFIVLPAKLINAVVFNELDKTVVLDKVLPELV